MQQHLVSRQGINMGTRPASRPLSLHLIGQIDRRAHPNVVEMSSQKFSRSAPPFWSRSVAEGNREMVTLPAIC
jgi:hypothetical protein